MLRHLIHFGSRKAFSLFFMCIVLYACTPPQQPNPNKPGTPEDQNKTQVGQTKFTTEALETGDAYETIQRTGAPSAGAQSDATNNTESKKAAPSGRKGNVEEADLYRISNDKLFYLNTYKGLTIFDLSNPKAPRKLKNLPIYGVPIEMFVDSNTVYALVKDALYLLQTNGKFEFHRRHTSQLVSIDISDINNPVVLQRFDIKGHLREGVSRKIEDTLYVVSYTPRNYWWGWSYNHTSRNQSEQATVYSFNVENPRNIRKVQSLDLLKNLSYNKQYPDGTGNESRSFTNIAISATANTLLVAEQWRTSKYQRAGNASKPRRPDSTGYCGRSRSEYFATTYINVVDISDPKGNIKLHTRFSQRGTLGDQFKQTYIYDPKQKQGIYYGIFQRSEWKYENCRSQRIVRNTLISMDISDGNAPKKLD
ncbi:MAG: beta-propeller domain-containing protein, partial [Myxococcota bacterium]